MRKQEPEDSSETSKADASDGSARGVDAGDGASANGAVEASARLVCFFVSLNQTRSSRKDRRKSKKQAPYSRSEALGYQACRYANNSAECEAKDGFVKLDALQSSEFCLNDQFKSFSKSSTRSGKP